MGISKFTGFTINPYDLIQSNPNLLQLELPFSQEEIDSVIKFLPNNKSPRPDGFNNEFIKATWALIKMDFYELCEKFYEHNCCLRASTILS
jgi:hypothetical protein